MLSTYNQIEYTLLVKHASSPFANCKQSIIPALLHLLLHVPALPQHPLHILFHLLLAKAKTIELKRIVAPLGLRQRVCASLN